MSAKVEEDSRSIDGAVEDFLSCTHRCAFKIGIRAMIRDLKLQIILSNQLEDYERPESSGV